MGTSKRLSPSRKTPGVRVKIRKKNKIDSDLLTTVARFVHGALFDDGGTDGPTAVTENVRFPQARRRRGFAETVAAHCRERKNEQEKIFFKKRRSYTMYVKKIHKTAHNPIRLLFFFFFSTPQYYLLRTGDVRGKREKKTLQNKS